MTGTERTHTADPRGAIAALKERVTTERLLNEYRAWPVTMDLTERVVPSFAYDEGLRTVIELRLGASYTVFHGDKDMAVMHHKQSAYRALADLMYRDVLMDLRKIIQAAGDGKRGETLELLGELYERLRS